jgi:hypothetical protein
MRALISDLQLPQRAERMIEGPRLGRLLGHDLFQRRGDTDILEPQLEVAEVPGLKVQLRPDTIISGFKDGVRLEHFARQFNVGEQPLSSLSGRMDEVVNFAMKMCAWPPASFSSRVRLALPRPTSATSGLEMPTLIGRFLTALSLLNNCIEAWSLRRPMPVRVTV